FPPNRPPTPPVAPHWPPPGLRGRRRPPPAPPPEQTPCGQEACAGRVSSCHHPCPCPCPCHLLCCRPACVTFAANREKAGAGERPARAARHRRPSALCRS